MNYASFTFDILWLISVVVLPLIKLILDKLNSRKQDEKVEAAEKKAFELSSDDIDKIIEKFNTSQQKLETQTSEISKIIDDTKDSIRVGRLFNLYSKQIEKYQKETQSRASWSFIFAIIAMVSGLGFVFWGGTNIILKAGWTNIVAGSAIASIGGAVSAYITKTFLNVHKLSLTQLNRYFKQPVLNENILTAQRLADSIDDKEFKLKSYATIINSISQIITSDLSEDGKDDRKV
ncbi:MAG: hypothetical protein KJ571_18790 [Bacteroidetes bacterium]|nr:hypothetical protein [Bacteroidota bacterium]